MSISSLTIELPKHFHVADFFSFHERDEESLAERIIDSRLEKGILWGRFPAQISFDFAQAGTVDVTLQCDGNGAEVDLDVLQKLAEHMLGLDQPIEVFEAYIAKQASPLSSLVAEQKGLRIPQSATPFEAFSWAIIGQQISVKAAVSIRRKFIQCFGVEHSSGLFCYPNTASLEDVVESQLQAIGFSKAKAAALLLLVEKLNTKTLIWPDSLDASTCSALSKALLALKGIGPWTVSYGLLRGFSWLDGSLHGDVAVRRNLQRLLASELPIDAAATERWLADFSPWRALVAAHLWAMSSKSGY